MIIYVFKSFSAVQIFHLSYIHLQIELHYTLLTRLDAAAFIKFFANLVRTLFEGSVNLKPNLFLVINSIVRTLRKQRRILTSN